MGTIYWYNLWVQFQGTFSGYNVRVNLWVHFWVQFMGTFFATISG